MKPIGASRDKGVSTHAPSVIPLAIKHLNIFIKRLILERVSPWTQGQQTMRGDITRSTGRGPLQQVERDKFSPRKLRDHRIVYEASTVLQVLATSTNAMTKSFRPVQSTLFGIRKAVIGINWSSKGRGNGC